MASGKPIGTMFIEVDMDMDRFTRSQRLLVSQARSSALNVEENFRRLGIKSSENFDLMRQRAVNAYNAIAASSKVSATDRLRAEKALNDQLKLIDKEQTEGRTRMFQQQKEGWAATTRAILRYYAAFYVVSNAMKTAISLTRELFDVAASAAQMEKAFTEIAGSASAANSEIGFLRDTANQLGQNFWELQDSYKGLLAASMATTMAGKETRDIFLAVTKASATLGLSAEKTKLTLYAVEQMMSKGKISSEELRRQMGDNLPGAFSLAAQAMNMTTLELDKALKAGTVMAEDFLPKFAKVLDEKYTGEVVSSVAAMNKWNEAVRDMKTAIASGEFLESATKALQELTETIKDPEVISSLAMLASELGKVAVIAAKTAGWIKDIVKWTVMLSPGGYAQWKGMEAEAEKKALEDLKDSIEDVMGASHDAAEEQELLGDEMASCHSEAYKFQKTLDSMVDVPFERWLENSAFSADELNISIGTVTDLVDKFTKKVGESGKELQMFQAQIAHDTKIIMEGAGSPVFGPDAIEATKEATSEMSETYKNMLEDIQDETSDVFYDIFSGEIKTFKDFCDEMLDYFKRILAQIMAEAVTAKIFGTTGGSAFSSAFAGTALGNALGIGGGGENIIGGTNFSPGLAEIGFGLTFLSALGYATGLFNDRSSSSTFSQIAMSAGIPTTWGYGETPAFPFSVSGGGTNDQIFNFVNTMNTALSGAMDTIYSEIEASLLGLPEDIQQRFRARLSSASISSLSMRNFSMTGTKEDVDTYISSFLSDVYMSLQPILDDIANYSDEATGALDEFTRNVYRAADSVYEITRSDREKVAALEVMLGGGSAQDARLAQIATRYHWAETGYMTNGEYNWDAIRATILAGGNSVESLLKIAYKTGLSLDEVIGDVEYLANILLEQTDDVTGAIEDSTDATVAALDDMVTSFRGVVEQMTMNWLGFRASTANPFYGASDMNILGELQTNAMNAVYSGLTLDPSSYTKAASALGMWISAAQDYYQRPSSAYGDIYSMAEEAYRYLAEHSADILSEYEIQVQQRDLLAQIAANTSGGATSAASTGSTGSAISTVSGVSSGSVGTSYGEINTGAYYHNTVTGRTTRGDAVWISLRTGSSTWDQWEPVGYAQGTNYVPYDGFYYLHQGEQVKRSGSAAAGDTVNLTINAPNSNPKAIEKAVMSVLPYALSVGKAKRVQQRNMRYS